MVRFDTRDKKPKVYNIAILSGIAVLVVIALNIIPKEPPLGVISAVVTVYVAAALVMLVRAFFEQLKYNPYSYNTIYYIGFSLFLLSVCITNAVATVNIFQQPELYDVPMIAMHLLASSRNFMLLSAPFVLVFSVLLVISNISLLRHEVRRFVNVLGILLAVLMVGGEVFLFFADYYASGSMTDIIIHEILVSLFAAFYLYFECMLIGAGVGDQIAARYWPDRDKDYMIILGCSIRKDGTPTPLLAGRCNRAIEFYKQQLEETGKPLIFVPSGGQGNDEGISESLSMRNYLISQGIPEEHILMEDQSRNTYENMKFSKEKIMAQNPDAKVGFSTTNYHVFRSGMMARRVKMRAQGVGAKTKWYFWPNASVREFAGLLKQHRGKQIIIILAMIAIYVGLVFLAYPTTF